MSHSSSSSSVALPNPFSDQVTKKLTRDNFLPWKTQVLPSIRGANLMGYLDGTRAAPTEEIDQTQADKTVAKAPNPEYLAWVSWDQQILGYLFRSLSRDVLLQVMDKTTSCGLWEAIEEMFSSQSRARVIQLRTQLTNTKKGDLSASA